MKTSERQCPFCGNPVIKYQAYRSLMVAQCQRCGVGSMFDTNKNELLGYWDLKDRLKTSDTEEVEDGRN